MLAIDDDAAPRPERGFAVWQRPLLDHHTGARASANLETAMLLSRFVEDGHQTLAFTRSRRGSELVAAQARGMLDEVCTAGTAPAVAAYRAGYLADERRELEAKLASGELGGVVATSALELGIDVGALDAVVCNGFPGTVASMRQQMGRAGRGTRRAAAVLVAGDDQLDQWYVRHPSELLGRPAEAAVVNPANPFVARAQIACAAHEMPLTHDDEQWFGDCLDDAVRDLVLADQREAARRPRVLGRAPASGRVRRAAQRVVARVPARRRRRAARGHRRFGTGVPGRASGCDLPAPGPAVPGRVARHRRPRGGARARRRPRRAHAATRGHRHHRSSDDDERASVGVGVAHLGSVTVTHHLVAYQRRRSSTNEIIDTVPLDFPPRELTDSGLLVHGAARAARGCRHRAARRSIGAVHAAEHALIGLLPLFAICDRWDVGGVSMALHPQTGEPTIFVYDGYPGGAGIAELAFARLTEHIAAAHELVAHVSV